MWMPRLQASLPLRGYLQIHLTFSRINTAWSASIRRRTTIICSFSQMASASASSSSSPLTHTIQLPSRPGQPVQVIAAPGLSDSDFRSAIECSLFKKWLKNMQGEKGVLADGAMLLDKVLIQGVDYFGKRIGFLKFKADVIDKETGKTVPGIVFARGPAVTILILLESEGETYAVLTEQGSYCTVVVGTTSWNVG